jgi:AraC family transcriptional regulator
MGFQGVERKVAVAKSRESEGAATERYAARVNRVIDYINANLDGDLSLEVLAGVASFSAFHFHRQFRAYTGIGVARLVRLLRLKRAELRLAFNPELSIMEIALESGFNSADSFSRAFREVYGQSPAEFQKRPYWFRTGVVEILAKLQEKRVSKDVQIVDFPTTAVAAVEYRGAPEHEYSAIRKLVAWRRENGVRPDHGKTIGIHYNDPAATSPEDYWIDICVSFDRPIEPNSHGVVAKEIPGGRCARIRHLGSRNYIGEAEYLYKEWLPRSGEELRDFPPFFHYVNVGPGVHDDDMITDVYLPLK